MNFGTVSTLKYMTGIGGLLILLFTALRPAGASELHVLESLLFWTIQISILLPMLIATHIGLQHIPRFDRLNPWIKTAIAGFIGATLFSPIAMALDYVMEMDDWSLVSTLKDAAVIWIDEMQGVVPPVTITWIGINAPHILKLNFNEPVKASAGKNVEIYEKPSIKLFTMISPHLGDDIIYITSELHYVRVVTTLGEELILYNLKDAIENVGKQIVGMQTHRSYWVATKHIHTITNQGSAKVIALSNGHSVPLSRRKATEVKQYLEDHRCALQ